MPRERLSHAAAGLVALGAVIACASLVGPDVALGLYHSDGSASPFGVWVNDVPTEDSMCVWFTYSTPDANKDHVVATNMSIGPMYANINATVKAFESRTCEPWSRSPEVVDTKHPRSCWAGGVLVIETSRCDD